MNQSARHGGAVIATLIAIGLPCFAQVAFAQALAPGDTELHRAARDGNVAVLRALVQRGVDVNLRDAAGGSALIAAAEQGRLEAARLLVQRGADLNVSQRGLGTALETAERAGHSELAAMLRKSGAQSSGRSVGDKVCVRSWDGDGYCGTVEDVNRSAYRIHVTEIIGCNDGCPAKAECSAGKAVGGADGLHAGDSIATVSWCLTHTGVAP